MLDVCLLGTGGMMPLPYRWLTALMVRCSGSNLLIDCGEGTQIALKEKGWSPKPVDVICFTHYHADHISGLPGLLLTMGNAERTEPITMIGPKGLERVVTALRTIAPELPFPLEFIELTEPRQQLQIGPYVIDAYRVNHNVTCYGYSISIPRKGRFDVERARAQEIPQKFWSRLQKGETIVDELQGKTYLPEMVMGAQRKGIKLTYCTDTRPTQSIVDNAMHSDLFICEGMYGEKDKDGLVQSYFPSSRGIKTARYTLALYIDRKTKQLKKSLLFDDVNDPYQLNNLPLDENKEVVEQLYREMGTMLKEIDDPWYTEKILSDRIPY